jgi:hypothetical protein
LERCWQSDHHLEGYLVGPFVLGRAVRLHPVAVHAGGERIPGIHADGADARSGTRVTTR